ncbi:sensor histidine kinase [Paenibacillus sp. D2_2]|uniref:sensor histidine kinase n=1 Tax=Paenibacillus sp. D2_2 TaxID=3073092 RepID=UPI002816485A|nr:sensor histidine kinase [Paenibacillus sp. D2_2]WMT39966.1 sensor histidine kinase [Paenibacillus sp. D2_2]
MMNTGDTPKQPSVSLLRPRTLLVSLLLAFPVIQDLLHEPLHNALPGALLIIYCICLLWWPTAIQKYGMVLGAAIFGVIFAFAAWLGFGLNGAIVTVFAFLIIWVTYRLPTAYSAGYTVVTAIIAANILYYVEQHSFESLVTYTLALAAIYLMLWGSRTRKETRLMKERHHEELKVAHQQLESAYVQLHKAHLELEEASERSLRYAVFEERSRIAADIHDSIGHGLTSVIVQLQALPYMVEASPEEAGSALRNVTEIARSCLQDVRSVVHEMGLSYQISGLHELQKLSHNFSKQNGLPVSFAADIHEEVAPNQIYVLYRILQEALTNISRHAMASSASVYLTEDNDYIIMIIRDDGQAQSAIIPGFGLTAMKGRCDKAGGTMTIQPIHPHGLELTIQLPRSVSTKSEVVNIDAT